MFFDTREGNGQTTFFNKTIRMTIKCFYKFQIHTSDEMMLLQNVSKTSID